VAAPLALRLGVPLPEKVGVGVAEWLLVTLLL
jgi:hypothetical protein